MDRQGYASRDNQRKILLVKTFNKTITRWPITIGLCIYNIFYFLRKVSAGVSSIILLVFILHSNNDNTVGAIYNITKHIVNNFQLFIFISKALFIIKTKTTNNNAPKLPATPPKTTLSAIRILYISFFLAPKDFSSPTSDSLSAKETLTNELITKTNTITVNKLKF